jgi:hypothetical protein
VSVYNGSDINGLAKREADKMEEKGFNISTIGNAPSGDYDRIEIYKVSSSSLPFTTKNLEQYFNTVVKSSGSPVDAGFGVDFVVILGEDTQGSSN